MPGVSGATMRRALSCAPAPCTDLIEGLLERRKLGQLSADNTDDDFWPLLESSSCDKRLFAIAAQTAAVSDAQATELVKEAPMRIEKIFGSEVTDAHTPQ
jgi:hypothetical protein